MKVESKIKLLQLRKYKKSFGFISNYEGPLFTKVGLRAKKEAVKIKSKFQKDADKFHWTPPPRARIAISFKFYCRQQNPPEIYNIVKYYLDLLKGPVFKDDSQVHYLEAYMRRTVSKKTESCLYIKARRLVDYTKILDLCQELDETYENYYKETVFPFPSLIEKSLWNVAETQYEILSNSKISKYDRPSLKKYLLPTMMKRFNGIDPLNFDFGPLPQKGESKNFKKNIHILISNFKSKYKLFNTIYSPIELDVQVSQASLKHIKDLDNVATEFCKEFKKQLLHQKVFINGYRIYVVDNNKSGIQLRLLPPGEVMSYNEILENGLERLEEKLTDKYLD